MPEQGHRPPISLGDAIRVEAELRPRDEPTRAAIDRLLGVERAEEPPTNRAVGPWKPHDTPVAGEPAGEPVTDGREPAPLSAGAAPPRLRGSTATAQFIGRTSFAPPSWAPGTADFEPAAGDDGSLPPPSLFPPSRKRALLAAAVASLVDGPEIDVPRIGQSITRGVRPVTIVYRRIATLARGAQVLIDSAETMDPLRNDISSLLADLEALLGRGRFEYLQFAYCPSARDGSHRGVWQAGQHRRPWRPAGGRVPVLIVSDFALAPRVDDAEYASLAEWIEFAEDVRAAGCAPVALVAHAPGRWPAVLTRKMTFLHWSERTTAGQIKKAMWDAAAALGRR